MAKKLGYTSVFLVGDPAYYHRFGFKSAAHFGIKHKPNIPDEYVMGCELVPGALYEIGGTIHF
ncbi:hypothetical protein [Desulforamulus ruminis]|uniref:hypothetical protein n=1 Tax=Desulforamulus ruminis TaxID=1564 RepID=UPI0002DD268E|nr:hypothetical protein [Desulforamulus ruminis]